MCGIVANFVRFNPWESKALLSAASRTPIIISNAFSSDVSFYKYYSISSTSFAKLFASS